MENSVANYLDLSDLLNCLQLTQSESPRCRPKSVYKIKNQNLMHVTASTIWQAAHNCSTRSKPIDRLVQPVQ